MNILKSSQKSEMSDKKKPHSHNMGEPLDQIVPEAKSSLGFFCLKNMNLERIGHAVTGRSHQEFNYSAFLVSHANYVASRKRKVR